MHNYTTIIGVIRMRKDHISIDKVRQRYGIGSSGISLIMKRFEESGLTFKEFEALEPSKVEEIIYPKDNLRRKKIPLPDFKAIYERLMAKGSKANLFYQWMEYKKDNPDGYQYSQFVEYFNRYVEEHYAAKKVSMAVERIPGERIYIDWVGDKPELVYDPDTGKMKQIHTFVTTVGVSNYMYAEIFENEKIDNFVKGTVHALEYYGAVPKYLVPDNAATAVTKHTKDELLINSTYEDLESFYDTIVLPPPAYKPKGKATVEKYVDYLETWLLEELKKDTYSSFESINIRARQITDSLNDQISKGYDLSRREIFEKYDKPQMKAIGDRSFTLCDYVFSKSVSENYHVYYDDHYYSVPYTYYHKSVILKATMYEIRIVDENNRLICTHQRSYRKFPKYITKDEHMAPDHRFYKEVNAKDGDHYRNWARAIGEDMYKLIDIILHSVKHEQQAYNSCNGILHMCDGRSKVLANEAAKKCIELGSAKYTYFKKIFNEFLNNDSSISKALPEHENLWGKDFYK